MRVAGERGILSLRLLSNQWRVLAIVGLVAASLTSAPRRPYSPHEKAFYADAQTVEFVLPGLTITVNSAAIAANGTITVTYTLTDPNGLPLDSAGVTTPGTISLSYVAAVLPNGQEDYTTYTTRSATGTVLGTIQQPGADSGGRSPPSDRGNIHTRSTRRRLRDSMRRRRIPSEFMDRET